MRSQKPGFTLIELVVVISIVLVLLGLVLPGASRMWEDRKVADAENTIRGLLVTARARAQRPNATETGLLFYLDRSGAQQIVTIEQAAPEALDARFPECADRPNPNFAAASHNRQAWNNVFTVTDQQPYTLPAPMRVVPRYIVEDTGVPMYTFDENELSNNDFERPYSNSFDVPQRHRNFFTIVFDGRGMLQVWRDVLILDPDSDADGRGDVTGIRVAMSASRKPLVSRYLDLDPALPLDRSFGQNSQDRPEKICYLVAAFESSPGDPPAINLPSVDGLLVYDDAAFADSGDATAKRNYLLRSGQPFYVNRLTGAVIRGPVGENF